MEADSGLVLIRMLATSRGGSEGVHLDIIWVDRDLHIIDLRHDRYGDGRGVNSSLTFRLGDSLDSMHSAFELELGVDTFTADLDHGKLHPADAGSLVFDDLSLPSLSLAIPKIHAE